MPLVNCILCFLNHALFSSWWYLLVKLVVYVSTIPWRVEPMPSLICVNSEVFTSHTHLVFHQVKLSTLMPLSKRGVNGRLYIEEVGVDLELCVHAHGHDVDLIIKASLKLIIPRYKFLYLGSGLLQSWFWPCSPLNTISRASLSTCLLQSNTPVQPLLWFVVEYYPPGISRLSRNCITYYEFSIKYYILIDSNFSRAPSY